MPTKRAVLAELTAAELRANVDYYELEVPRAAARVLAATRADAVIDPKIGRAHV